MRCRRLTCAAEGFRALQGGQHAGVRCALCNATCRFAPRPPYVRRDRNWRGAGVAVPVFSLRSGLSVGVGEFLDLIPLIDLADR
jgi:hypothetical protein